MVSAISDALAARWGAGAAWRQDAASHPHEARLLELDSALARSRLGWAPRWRLTDTLDRTVDWYKAFYRGIDMQAFTFAQIDGFISTPDVRISSTASTIPIFRCSRSGVSLSWRHTAYPPRRPSDSLQSSRVTEAKAGVIYRAFTLDDTRAGCPRARISNKHELARSLIVSHLHIAHEPPTAALPRRWCQVPTSSVVRVQH